VRHSWWLRQEIVTAAARCVEMKRNHGIDWHNYEVATRKREAELQRLREANTIHCKECGELLTEGASAMRDRYITPRQHYFIVRLVNSRQLDVDRKMLIMERLATHDRLWALKAIHQLLKHTPVIDTFELEAEPF